MGISVDGLLQVPHLRLRLHSGGEGRHREVSWTHTSDLPQPWQWITGGEMLMTNGLSFPKSAAAQQALLEQLDEVGASALAIGEEMYCPRLTRQFERTSERLRFPVLLIRYPLPFVAISRTVAEATLLEQSQRLHKTARIYDTIRRTTTDRPDHSRLLDTLARELGCELHLCHRESGQAWYPQSPATEAALAQVVAEASTTAQRLTAGTFASALPDGREAMIMKLPTHEHAVLTIVRNTDVSLDPILLQHAATVLALELTQTELALEHERRFGAELLTQLLDNHIGAATAERQLDHRELPVAETVLVTARTDDQQRVRELHLGLWRLGMPHLCLNRAGLVHAVLPDQADLDGVLAHALGPSRRVGISRRIGVATRINEAAREASWALGIAERTNAPLARYGEAAPWIGLSDIGEAQALIDRVLHPLLDHDTQYESELVETLQAFLNNRRSWQGTAAALHVHRQTVLYRIKKIEQITHRKLAETGDIAELWLALRARELTAPANQPRPPVDPSS